MWRSEFFSSSFEISHFNIYPLIFLSLGQTLYLVINISTTYQTKAVMTAKFHCWTQDTLPVWINDRLLKKTKKEWLLNFSDKNCLICHILTGFLWTSNFSRGCKFYICFTNIWFMHNSSAMHRWPKESLPLKVYRIPICLAEYPSYKPGRFENHEYRRTQE